MCFVTAYFTLGSGLINLLSNEIHRCVLSISFSLNTMRLNQPAGNEN